MVETLGDNLALASLRPFRLSFPLLPGEVTPERWTFSASAVNTDDGGGNNDIEKWGYDIEVSGLVTKTLGA